MKIALAQINVTLGDIEGNKKKIIQFIKKAKLKKADVIAFPELCICGYPIEDLVFHPDFVNFSYQAALDIIENYSKNCLIILGTPRLNSKPSKINKHFNSALIGLDGKLINCYDKIELPNYGVFDEKRYFNKGAEFKVIEYLNKKILISICEDIWAKRWIKNAPINQCDLLINISASPYTNTKIKKRKRLIQSISQKSKKSVYLCNLVGGQDELVFDGNSMISNPNGEIIKCAKHCLEDLIYFDSQLNSLEVRNPTSKNVDKLDDQLSEIYQVLKLGTFDYLRKNNFNQVVLGLSGGIDSALNLALLVDCIGKENVLAISLPTRFNQDSSLNDAILQCKILGSQHRIFNIEPLFQNYIDQFKKNSQALTGLSLQNIQARIRSNILMAVSNEEHRLLITTSNKSEIAVGYSTIYGDMTGAFCPLKDVQKTLVYQLANWLNQSSNTNKIPQSVINKAPSAELMENQTDQDNLPSYANLDAIMNRFMSSKTSKKVLYEEYKKSDVDRVVDLMTKNQYKRFQSPPGIKITDWSFTKDWRYPITNQF